MFLVNKFMNMVDTKTVKEYMYSLGYNAENNKKYLSIPVTNSMCDYTEWYYISDDEYNLFMNDIELGRFFANECRKQNNDNRLVLRPGLDRGVAREI